MRFAVVEYASKTGAVWKHTVERPNYLADPIREIDPTSFGCYVSALNGEHIPILGLVVGPVNPVSSQQRFLRKVYKKIAGTWPLNYSLNYLIPFDVLLVVHQLSDTRDIINFIRRIKKSTRRPFIVGVPTQPYGILRAALEKSSEAQKAFQEYLAECDVFLTVVQETLPWYATLTSTPVIYMPQPYPAHFAQQFYRPRATKEKILFVAGVTQRDNIRKGQIVAKLLQKKHPEYLIKVPKVPDLPYDDSELKGARYQMIDFEEWREHLPTLASMRLVINTDYTATRGRVQTDCAAVGTPSLGANSDGQRDLFPSLYSAPHTSIDELVALGEKILVNDGFYESTVSVARERLAKYDYTESADRLRILVKTYTQEATSK